MLFFFFSFFSSLLLSSSFLFSLPPSRNSDPGSHSRLFSPAAHYGSCLACFSREDCRAFFPRRLVSNCAYPLGTAGISISESIPRPPSTVVPRALNTLQSAVLYVQVLLYWYSCCCFLYAQRRPSIRAHLCLCGCLSACLCSRRAWR